MVFPLRRTQVKVVGVEHELWQVEELWDELLDVGHVVFGGGEPGLSHTVVHAIRQVKVTALQVTIYIISNRNTAPPTM